ncbi:protein phosphatase 2C domain-containing protein [Cellulomonas sp. ATA003]|uniref:PP2C family protein-serine/threonine phosphatase n=1 Tax=Cellulomonas sp. ATA003 TaxID=3073064 RepID=UPI002872C79F|nr:protein phosphatase 2C domain-containing protein [Cellulomonas sp. ATA003]WNB85574.1 protein phosphatase 2C domain-containing protein [Cellulomonas sp. ATA003]
MTIALRYAARSDVGLVRANNQDSAYAGPHLLVVADGMGGHAGGDVASSVAVATLAPLDDEAHGPDDALAELDRALHSAQDELLALADADPELAGLGTTVTALLRAGSKLAMAHIGDSRAYLLRDGDLTQVTTDHTFVQHLVNTGKITAEEAETHPSGRSSCGCSATSTWRSSRTCPCARRAPATAGCCAPTACPAWSARRRWPRRCAACRTSARARTVSCSSRCAAAARTT